MFNLFRSATFIDTELGVLERSRGRWRGKINLQGKSIALAIAGPRDAPDVEALAIAKSLPAAWLQNLDSVGRALMNHLEPYAEAVAASEIAPPSQPLPSIETPSDMWPFVEIRSASVTPLDGKLISEVALQTTWDEEHTLGARFDGMVFQELNGSIRPE